MKRPLKEPDRADPLVRNQEYAYAYDWECTTGFRVDSAVAALVGGREGADCPGDVCPGMSLSLVARQEGIAPN